MRLDPHTQVIRVVEFATARFDDVVIVKLHKNIVKDRPLYDAPLSYVWGDGTSPDAAIVKDLQATIGFSLDSALRHLRQVLDGGVRIYGWARYLSTRTVSKSETSKSSNDRGADVCQNCLHLAGSSSAG